MPSSPQLSIRSLTKRYGAIVAIRDVSFDVTAGEIFGLVGPNGAGKTTTLECVLGLRRPDAGTISINGLDAVAHPEQAKEIVGAQIQGAELQEKITPRQALRLFGRFYRNAAKPDELIEQFSLEEKADAPFASLSGGQKQRLFLALAFVNRPQVIVLDEPTAGLDPKTRRELHAWIRRARDDGKIVVLSTHYLDEAQQLCDRIGVVDRGRIVAMGTANELIARAATLPRIVLRTHQPIPTRLLSELPGIVACRHDGAVATLTAHEVNPVLVALVGRLHAEAIALLDVQVQRPTLEDVFLEITGRPYSASNDNDEDASP